MRQNWFCPVYNSQNLTRASALRALRRSGPVFAKLALKP